MTESTIGPPVWDISEAGLLSKEPFLGHMWKLFQSVGLIDKLWIVLLVCLLICLFLKLFGRPVSFLLLESLSGSQISRTASSLHWRERSLDLRQQLTDHVIEESQFSSFFFSFYNFLGGWGILLKQLLHLLKSLSFLLKKNSIWVPHGEEEEIV